jgi:hypothetical protein
MELCPKCTLAHSSQQELGNPDSPCETALKRAIHHLLFRVGRLDRCKWCRASIYWVVFIGNERQPFNEGGLPHRYTCPNFLGRKSKSADVSQDLLLQEDQRDL